MTKIITQKEKERIFLRSACILFIFVVAGLLVTYPLSREERFLPMSASIVLGILVSGLYAMPKLARDYEDLLMGYSGVVALVAIFVGFFSFVHFREAGILQGSDEVLLFFGYIIPLSMVAAVATYEIVDHKKSNVKLDFHAKRFVGRMVVLMSFLAVFLIFVELLSMFSPSQYVGTPALVFSSLLTSIVFYLVLRIRPQFKDFLKKLEKGEW